MHEFRSQSLAEQQRLEDAWEQVTRSDDVASSWAREYTEAEDEMRREEEEWFSQFLPGGAKAAPFEGPAPLSTSATSSSSSSSGGGTWADQYNTMNQGINDWAKEVRRAPARAAATATAGRQGNLLITRLCLYPPAAVRVRLLRREQYHERENQRQVAELAQKIAAIDNPKLQSSKFMQLLGGISRGELTISDKQLVSSTSSAAPTQ